MIHALKKYIKFVLLPALTGAMLFATPNSASAISLSSNLSAETTQQRAKKTQQSQRKNQSKNSASKKLNAKSGNANNKNTRSGKAATSLKSGQVKNQKNKPAPAKDKTPKTAGQIRQEKKQAEEDVKKTQQQLNFNLRQTERHLNDLQLIEGEIGDHTIRINELNQRIDSLGNRIGIVSDSIADLDKRLAAIQRNYARALRKTQGRGQQTSMMAFIFSSNSFGEAYRRMNSVKQFDKWRKNKENEIGAVRNNLNERRLSLTGLQDRQRNSQNDLTAERRTLQRKQDQTTRLVDSLKNRSAELDVIMRERAAQAAHLDAELDRIIAEEARAAAEAKKKAEEEARRQAEAKARAEAEARARAEAQAAEQARLKAEADAKAKADAEAKAKAEANAKAQSQSKATPAQEKQAPAPAISDTKQTKSDVPPPPARKSDSDKKKEVPPAKEKKGVKRKDKKGSEKAEVPPPPKREEKEKASVPPRSASQQGTTAPRLQSATGDYGSGTVSEKAPEITGTDFGQMKGQLMFPVTGRYTIVKRFGRQQHPHLPHVETTNSGIDIQTQPKAPVRAVFDGEVSAIFKPDGYNNVVVIRHGDYLTVYANLGQISVSAHQRVKAGQTIGTVYANPEDDGRSVLHFEIRLGRDKQDPELWLRR